jgi:two-component system sensor histidine kinase BaeS
VTDSGIGIPAEQLPFVFDRFWRADQVRSREAGGTGLGLAIARDIAKNHGAELGVESLPGQGSTFTIRLRFGDEDRVRREPNCQTIDHNSSI